MGAGRKIFLSCCITEYLLLVYSLCLLFITNIYIITHFLRPPFSLRRDGPHHNINSKYFPKSTLIKARTQTHSLPRLKVKS